MSKANPHFEKIKGEHIFPYVEKEVETFKAHHPHDRLLNFGVGDVALPLKPFIAKAISDAAFEMTKEVYGYGSSFGYPFLRQAIIDHEYSQYGLTKEEVFISDGTISDATGLLDLFDTTCKVALMDPTYPVYIDACVLAGRTKAPNNKGLFPDIIYLPCKEESHFIPEPPKEKCDLIFLCSPNNPTGVAFSFKSLEKFVHYALEHEAIILLDAAYEAFIQSADVPKSIYSIPGAKKVAIEMKTFSKTAGFTGLRCSYVVIPKELTATIQKKSVHLKSLWERRQVVKFNGVAYPIQKGAEASLSKEGYAKIMQDIHYYQKNTALFKQALIDIGYTCYGGVDSPYIWCKTPKGMTSKKFFEHLLHKLHIVTIPGSGFGYYGEGYVRISGFTKEQAAHEAVKRLKTMM